MNPVFPAGVTVLKEYTYNPPAQLIFVIFIIAVVTLGIIASIKGRPDTKMYITFSILAILGLLGTFFAPKLVTPHEVYEVKIDDSVKFNEIYNKYEVIGINGSIYTLEERSN